MRTLEVMERVMRGKRRSVKTVALYERVFRSLAGVSENWPNESGVVSEWLAGLDGLGDETVRVYFKIVKSGGRYIERTGGKGPDGRPLYPNPCVDVDTPRVSKKRRRYFSIGELELVFGACRGETERVLIWSLLDSSARIGEFAGLEVGNVRDGFIKVKGKTGERTYRLDVRLCEAFRALRPDGGVIFQKRNGEAMSSNLLTCVVRRVFKRAGLTGDKLGPHTLRHTAGTLVARKSLSALAVKAVLQHDNIATSMGYIHDVEDRIAQEISPLGIVVEASARILGAPKQIPMRSGEGADNGGSDVVVGELVDKSFIIEVPDGAEVRPKLRTEELRFIRKLFAEHINSGRATGDEAMFCRNLMRSWLRFVK
ncbi:MAG: site-specific integrase [Dehalococcoidales bacterium]|nr:site-specific integrase [Dehalococcoidales bacterium]